MKILRWGQSAYETDADLLREKSSLEELGCQIIQKKDFFPSSDIQGLLVTSKVRISNQIIQQLPQLPKLGG